MKQDTLFSLWERFEKSGSIKDYLEYKGFGSQEEKQDGQQSERYYSERDDTFSYTSW